MDGGDFCLLLSTLETLEVPLTSALVIHHLSALACQKLFFALDLRRMLMRRNACKVRLSGQWVVVLALGSESA